MTPACGRCGRALTSRESIALGVGPVCGLVWGLTVAPIPRPRRSSDKTMQQVFAFEQEGIMGKRIGVAEVLRMQAAGLAEMRARLLGVMRRRAVVS